MGALLLYVVALRAFIPSDLMLDRDADTGKLAIVICSAQLTRTALFDAETGTLSEHTLPDEDSHKSADPGGTCPFALAGMPVLPSADGAVSATHFARHDVPGVPAVHAALAAHARPPLPPRGPPAIA